MQKSNEDCFYFITSNCAKGLTCPYRHNPAVLTCNVMCPAWLRGNCIDPNCVLRHSNIQRPVVNNGVTCFYENTPMGCLKPDCTFAHLRPRPNLRSPSTIRPSTTNLVNKEPIKSSPIPNPPSIPNGSTPEPTPTIKTETIPPPPPPPVPAPVPVEPEKPKSPVRESPETPSRTVVNRNVVIAESPNVPTRTVVHGTTTRVVVPSNDTDSDIDLDDLIEQENGTKNTKSVIDISFPCSAPRLFVPTKQTTNDTKPIRLNRDRLPATKISAPQTNGEKISAGTGLIQDDDRRTSRIERFKKKTISPPRSVVNPSKRPASDEITKEFPPAKRLSSQQQENNNPTTTIGDLCSPPSNSRRSNERYHQRRRRSSPSSSSSSSSSPTERKSPPRQTYPSMPPRSSMNDSAWKREVDEFLAKTTQPKPLLSLITVPPPSQPQPVPLLSLRPRFIPPLLQSPQQPINPRQPRPRQPPSVVQKRPSAPTVIRPSKPIEQTPPPPTPPPPPPIQSSKISKEQQDEDELLQLNEPTDIVDTFAVIDEALLDDDESFLELM